MRETLTNGTYKYAAGPVRLRGEERHAASCPTTLASAGAETKINGYVELASLKIDSEWAMTLDRRRQ